MFFLTFMLLLARIRATVETILTNYRTVVPFSIALHGVLQVCHAHNYRDKCGMQRTRAD